MQLLNAPPLVRCGLCGHVDEPGDEVSPGRSDPIMGWRSPSCDFGERCVRTRKGLPRRDPTVIRVSVAHLECACCHERFPSGYRHLEVQGGQLFHFPHHLCGAACKRRAVESVPA